jgi:drug/metabolite transporter (DMT)-like permease
VRTPPHQKRIQLVWGLLLGVASMALMAYGIVIAKPILNKMELLPASFIRLAAGTAALALFAIVRSDRRATFSVFRPARSWRFSLPGSVLGTYFALTLWIAGFKYADASIAAILNQTSFLFTIILAAIVLREPFGPKKVLCVFLSAAGITMVGVQTAFPGWLDDTAARLGQLAGILPPRT